MSAWDDMIARCAEVNKALDLRPEDFPGPNYQRTQALFATIDPECSMIVAGEPLATEIEP